MVDIGFNYRITDFQCALGSSAKKIKTIFKKDEKIALKYKNAFIKNCKLLKHHVQGRY